MKKFIFPIVTILIIAALVLVNYFQQRVPENPGNTLGNTSGNLQNGGLFCEHNGPSVAISVRKGISSRLGTSDMTAPI